MTPFDPRCGRKKRLKHGSAFKSCKDYSKNRGAPQENYESAAKKLMEEGKRAGKGGAGGIVTLVLQKPPNY